MEATTDKPLGPARIVALVVIALAVSALAYLRFAPDSGPVSVPPGAHAGELILKPCTYPTANGSYRADCGTLVVPENRADAQSRLIALPVTRIRARSADPGTPIFRLEGGPGKTNMEFSKASRFADERDVVLVGYRGVDGSSRLDCPEVTTALRHSEDFLGTKSKRAYSDAFRSCAERLQADGADLAGYTLPQRVEDLEAARRALGYRRINLVSESAGTRTAMIYSWRHPESIRRSVMIGANPPGHFVFDPKTTDAQLRRYSGLCAQDDACLTQIGDLATSMRRTAADIPDRWLFLPIKQGNVRLASFFGLAETSSDAGPISAPMTLNSWIAAAHGDASGFWFMSVLADLAFPKAFVWGEMAATGIQDAPAANAYYSAGGDGGSILGNPATEFVWAGEGLVDGWPPTPEADRFDTLQTTQVETLLIGGTLDFATPLTGAGELLPHLPNGHRVVLRNFGHSGDFWTYQPDASTHLVGTFLDSGRVDDSRYTRQKVDFTPELRQTTLAKGIAGTMVGVAILAVLSLFWMALRVRRRGGFGRKASASLRSLHPIVLGLGGWFLGALLVMTTMPGTPLDSEVLAGLATGIPIGLGLYWAWVRGDWSRQTKAIGLSAALGGALVGAWLGFNATTGMLALVTAIAGAAVGGNLALLALDIAWDRAARERRDVRAERPALASAEVQVRTPIRG